jgi:hypothetical protein
MGLTYEYSFSAPANTAPEELESFLQTVEVAARAMGFSPTVVLNVSFDTPERRLFSRRLSGSCVIEDNHLKAPVIMAGDQVWHHEPCSGTARLIPERGVVLVITDEHGRESCFGFMKFPADLRDASGLPIMASPFGSGWVFRDFMKSPDPRYRRIVSLFADAGYLAEVLDEYR